MTEQHDETRPPGERVEDPHGAMPAREPEREARRAPPEVEAEPFDAARDRGPTIDAPGPGAKVASGNTLWPVACHLAPLAQLLFPAPGINVVAALVVWQWKRADPEVDDHGRESVNFQINVLVLTLLLTLSCFLSPLLLVLLVAAVVMVVIAALKASEGKRYRYPFILRLLKP